MLVTVADLVKLKPEFDEFSLLFHITSAFVSIILGWRLSASISINAILGLHDATAKKDNGIRVDSAILRLFLLFVLFLV